MRLKKISYSYGRHYFAVAIVIAVLVRQVSLSGATLQTARSEAMGGTRTAFPGDASVVFLNPAAVSNVDKALLYFDYSNNEIREVKAAFAVPLEKLGFGLSWYSRRNNKNETASCVAAAVSKKIFSGTPDTYIEVGANVRIEGFAFDFNYGCPACGQTRFSDSDITGDLGIIIRPLPIISFRYLAEGVRKSDKLDYESDLLGERGGRFGATVYLREKLVVSWERESRNNIGINHYGFCLKTGIPLELMAGFSREAVSGGARMKWKYMSFSLAFSQDAEGFIHQRVSFEIAPGQFAIRSIE